MHGPKLIVGAEVRRLAGRHLDAEERRHGAARRGSAVLPVEPNEAETRRKKMRRCFVKRTVLVDKISP
jgi:hypothetical protein